MRIKHKRYKLGFRLNKYYHLIKVPTQIKFMFVCVCKSFIAVNFRKTFIVRKFRNFWFFLSFSLNIWNTPGYNLFLFIFSYFIYAVLYMYVSYIATYGSSIISQCLLAWMFVCVYSTNYDNSTFFQLTIHSSSFIQLKVSFNKFSVYFCNSSIILRIASLSGSNVAQIKYTYI